MPRVRDGLIDSLVNIHYNNSINARQLSIETLNFGQHLIIIIYVLCLARAERTNFSSLSRYNNAR